MDTLRVVTIGGGTGHFTLLSGLKEHPLDITAIVSMADDGGSTGVLRDEMGVLPPGDVRQCLAALASEETLTRDLFSYRFSDGPAKGHSFGNLFLSALQKMSGSFGVAIEEAGRVLNIAGEVLPVTESDMRLVIELNDGSTLEGERYLDGHDRVRDVGVKGVALRSSVLANPKALQRIKEADVLIIGPGDLYGSTLPPLLVPAIATAVRESKAPLLYVTNLTNKRGQTDGFTADSYARTINQYLGAHCIDVVICNNEEPPPHLASRYELKEGGDMFVRCPHETNTPYSYEVVMRPLLRSEYVMLNPRDSLHGTRSFIRHDPQKLANVIMETLRKHFAN